MSPDHEPTSSAACSTPEHDQRRSHHREPPETGQQPRQNPLVAERVGTTWRTDGVAGLVDAPGDWQANQHTDQAAHPRGGADNMQPVDGDPGTSQRRQRRTVAGQTAGEQDGQEVARRIRPPVLRVRQGDQQQAGDFEPDARPPDRRESATQQQVCQRLTTALLPAASGGSRLSQRGKRGPEQEHNAAEHDEPIRPAAHRGARGSPRADQDRAEHELPGRQDAPEQGGRYIEPPAAEGRFRRARTPAR